MKLGAGLAGGVVGEGCCVGIWEVASEAIASDGVTGSGVLREGEESSQER